MSLVNQAKKGVFWTFLQQFSVQGINFVVQIVLARLLLPSDFGLVAMIAIFVAIGQSLSDSGMTSSLIRNNKNTEADYGTVFITNFVVSLIIYLVVYCTAPWVAKFYNQNILTDLLRTYSLIFIISSFYVVQIAKFTKELNFRSQFIYQLPSVIIGAVVAIIMAQKGFGVWSLIGLNISQAISFSLILWTFCNWHPKFIFDKSVFQGHFNYGYKLTISGIINVIYLNLYKIIIGKAYSPATVGFFTQADNLRAFPVNQLSMVLNKVTFPLFASIQNDIQLKNAYKKSLRLVLSLCSAIMFILMICAKPLFLLIFGEKWLQSVPYFQILCLASIFLPIGTYNLNILKVKGRTDLFLRVEVIKKLIGTITLILSIPFGIDAIVWALCITNILFAYINGYFSGKLISYSIKDQISNSLIIIIVSLVPATITYFIFNSLIKVMFNSNLVQVSLVSCCFMILYIPLVFIFNKDLLNDIKQIIRK